MRFRDDWKRTGAESFETLPERVVVKRVRWIMSRSGECVRVWVRSLSAIRGLSALHLSLLRLMTDKVKLK